MSEKIAINPKRLEWCLDNFKIDIQDLSKRLKISERTLEKSIHYEEVITIKQLEKLADFFGRSLLFLINPNEVEEEKIYSHQFRTINNQKVDLSIEIKKLIERIEKQREIFISLLEDLEEPISAKWHDYKKKENISITDFATQIRRWLKIDDQNNDFESIRENVESNGIMVVLTNGYKGKWQIDKKDSISGFSMYYEKMPVIVVRKEDSIERQSFTLLHELAHLLMHNESRIDDENEDFFKYDGKEKEANEFAGKILIPDIFLNQIKSSSLKKLNVDQYDSYLDEFKKAWGTSNQAIMFRLVTNKKVSQAQYNEYIKFKIAAKNLEKKERGGIRHRHKEPLKIFGENYVKTVFDAFHNNHITLSKASTYLDNLKIDTLKKLQDEL